MLFELWQAILLIIVALGLGFTVGIAIRHQISRKKLEEAEEKASTIMKDAEQQARSTRKEAELEAKDIQLLRWRYLTHAVHLCHSHTSLIPTH